MLLQKIKLDKKLKYFFQQNVDGKWGVKFKKKNLETTGDPTIVNDSIIYKTDKALTIESTKKTENKSVTKQTIPLAPIQFCSIKVFFCLYENKKKKCKKEEMLKHLHCKEKAAEDGIVLSSCPKRGTKQDNIGMLFK